MDTSVEPAMLVHRKDGSVMKFVEYSSGLYYFDVTSDNSNKSGINDYFFLETVANNRTMFTSRQVKDADRARILYAKLKRPSQARFESILASNVLKNCDLTPDDAKRALIIYGPDVFAIKAKSTKDRPTPIPSFVPISLPTYILEQHKNITLCVDFFTFRVTFFYIPYHTTLNFIA